MSYKVEWENEIDNATSPLEAAKLAINGIANGECVTFVVTDFETGIKYSVDLAEPEGDEVYQLT